MITVGKIKIMSENLANKIAAGEVVEKCASVVKELVENSIDAQSDDIKIDLENGGLKSIKITDNGVGMEADDALVAFQRHATSKLIREDDLFFINTLGFRGEALPSIASVSEVDLITCATDIGTHIHIKGGTTEVNEPSPARHGTQITISNLFYNTPARLKYLKSEQYELANTVSYIEKLALSYPHIKFTLSNNGKIIVKTSGSNNLLKTIHEIYGLQVSSNMIEISGQTDDYEMTGYICKPEILKSNRNHMITIVNGRVIRNNDLNRAINDAYFRYKPDIKYPVVVLKIETDPTLIDVNIHPTKQDIKMSKAQELYQMITETIQNALYKELLVPNALKEKMPENNSENTDTTSETISEETTGEQTELDLFNILPSTMMKPEESTQPKETKSLPKETKNTTSKPSKISADLILNEPTSSYQSVQNRLLNPEFKALNLEVIGQTLGTYIVCQNKTGLYLIDQHAAKERVNYERVTKEFTQKNFATTTMLIPMTIEFSASDFLKIKENISILNELGITIEEFGVNTYTIKAHPTWLKEGYEEEVIRSILDEIINLGPNFDQVRFNNKLIATIACKMSIRANTRLSKEAMEEIVAELCQCQNPYNCAHGRPTIVKFTTYELERMFKRVMN